MLSTPTYQQCTGISFLEKNYLWRYGQKARGKFVKPAITDLDLFFSISKEDVDNAAGIQKDNK